MKKNLQKRVNFEQKSVHRMRLELFNFNSHIFLRAETKPLLRTINAAIQVLKELFTELTCRYLTDYDSYCKDCISFIEYIRNMMDDTTTCQENIGLEAT